MRALKTLVIFMGLLIVAGVSLLVYGLATRLSETEEPAPRGAAETALALPEGCTLAEARAEEGRLILRSDGPAARGCQQVIVLDPESGQVLSRVTVVPRP